MASLRTAIASVVRYSKRPALSLPMCPRAVTTTPSVLCGKRMMSSTAGVTLAPPLEQAPHPSLLDPLSRSDNRPATVDFVLEKKAVSLPSQWLRHNCPCDKCVSSTGQRLFTATEFVNAKCIPTHVQFVQPSQMQVTWDDGHVSIFSGDWLAENNPLNPRPLVSPKPAMSIQRISMKELDTKEGTFKWLRHMYEDGVCIVEDAGVEPGVVVQLSERITHVQKTIYGKTFDVVSVPDPINIAYSSHFLELHQDLVYYESAPGLQLLHCMRFDETVKGGESLLLDSFAAAEHLREIDSDAFETLRRIPATFSKVHYKRESPVDMVYRRPHIVTNHKGVIISVTWAPPFEGKLQDVTMEEALEYTRAYRTYAEILSSPPESVPLLKFRLQPGEVLTFNNRRVLHGREEFSGDGVRHFEGSYVNIDEFLSKLRVLEKEVGVDLPYLSIGNHNS